MRSSRCKQDKKHDQDKQYSVSHPSQGIPLLKWVQFIPKSSMEMHYIDDLLYNKLFQMMKKKMLKKGEAPNEQQTQLYDRITKIEAQVLERIQKLKSSSKSFLCEHFNISSPDCQPYDPNINYYDKFWKRFLLNEIGKQNVAQFKQALQNFSKRLEKIDVNFGPIKSLFQEWEREVQPVTKTKPRHQKTSERQRQVCHHCGRTYKDQQTLMIHLKIKHGEHNLSQMQQKMHEDIFQQDNDSD